MFALICNVIKLTTYNVHTIVTNFVLICMYVVLYCELTVWSEIHLEQLIRVVAQLAKKFSAFCGIPPLIPPPNHMTVVQIPLHFIKVLQDNSGSYSNLTEGEFQASLLQHTGKHAELLIREVLSSSLGLKNNCLASRNKFRDCLRSLCTR